MPATLEEALAPLAGLGVDVAAVLRAVARQRDAPQGHWHPDDWRRTHPQFPEKLAFAIFVYTLQDPNIYKPLADAMHAADRSAGPGGGFFTTKSHAGMGRRSQESHRNAGKVRGCFQLMAGSRNLSVKSLFGI